jgi:8-oxo-dGTP pyrophosphatase MutT (NUDIX family)
LKENNFYELLEENNLSNYLEPEWEFPKGKKNMNETPLTCAIREFNEETNLNINNIKIFENINCIEEKYRGSDNKFYKHLYYLAISNHDLEFNNIDNISEVGDINWFTIEDAINKIRLYYINKIELINNIYNLINNIIKINI